jgi:alpha-N-acetylglucosamine transferase
MNMTITQTGFREVIESYDYYSTPIKLKVSNLQPDAVVEITPYEGYACVTIYRDYPFNEALKAATSLKAEAATASYKLYPTTRFDIDGWTPEKLAEVQSNNAAQAAAYEVATARLIEATAAYDAAFDAQFIEVENKINSEK